MLDVGIGARLLRLHHAAEAVERAGNGVITDGQRWLPAAPATSGRITRDFQRENMASPDGHP